MPSNYKTKSEREYNLDETSKGFVKNQLQYLKRVQPKEKEKIEQLTAVLKEKNIIKFKITLL